MTKSSPVKPFTPKRLNLLHDRRPCLLSPQPLARFVQEPGNTLEEAVKSGTKPIVALKSVRVGDFNGKNLSTLSSSRVLMEPNIPEAGWLRNWYNSSGMSSVAAPLSEKGAGGGRQDRRVTFAQIKDEGIGTTNGPEWVAVSWGARAGHWQAAIKLRGLALA